MFTVIATCRTAPEAARAVAARHAVISEQEPGCRQCLADRALDDPTRLEPWLDQAQTPAAQRGAISKALIEEIRGGPATGMRASHSDGELTITQQWLLARS